MTKHKKSSHHRQVCPEHIQNTFFHLVTTHIFFIFMPCYFCEKIHSPRLMCMQGLPFLKGNRYSCQMLTSHFTYCCSIKGNLLNLFVIIGAHYCLWQARMWLLNSWEGAVQKLNISLQVRLKAFFLYIAAFSSKVQEYFQDIKELYENLKTKKS